MSEEKKLERPHARLIPSADFFENDDEFLMFVDLPGVSPDDLELNYEDAVLRLSAKTERAEGTVVFDRTFQLPDSVDPEALAADLEAGVLKVSMKKKEAMRPRKIPVGTPATAS